MPLSKYIVATSDALVRRVSFAPVLERLTQTEYVHVVLLVGVPNVLLK